MPRIYIAVDKQRAVIERADGRCEYCQSLMDYTTETFAVEHVIPLSRGGTNELDNLALSRSGCNGHKDNKTEALDPADGKVVPLFNPRQQKWQTHFGWVDDYTHIIGLTPTGRATVEILRMNRIGLVNVRRLLYLIRQHPPKLNDI